MSKSNINEDWVEKIVKKIYDKLQAGNNYAIKKRMQRDPQFARMMKDLEDAQRGLEDYVKYARSKPDIAKLMDKIERGEKVD